MLRNAKKKIKVNMMIFSGNENTDSIVYNTMVNFDALNNEKRLIKRCK